MCVSGERKHDAQLMSAIRPALNTFNHVESVAEARLGYSSAAGRGSSQGVIDWARLRWGGLRNGIMQAQRLARGWKTR